MAKITERTKEAVKRRIDKFDKKQICEVFGITEQQYYAIKKGEKPKNKTKG